LGFASFFEELALSRFLSFGGASDLPDASFLLGFLRSVTNGRCGLLLAFFFDRHFFFLSP